MPVYGEKYLDIHQVAEKVGLSTRTVRRWVKLKRFPPPFEFAGGWAWLQSEVDRWMFRTATEKEIDPDTLPDDEKTRGQSAELPGPAGTSSPAAGNEGSEKKPRR